MKVLLSKEELELLSSKLAGKTKDEISREIEKFLEEYEAKLDFSLIEDDKKYYFDPQEYYEKLKEFHNSFVYKDVDKVADMLIGGNADIVSDAFYQEKLEEFVESVGEESEEKGESIFQVKEDKEKPSVEKGETAVKESGESSSTESEEPPEEKNKKEQKEESEEKSKAAKEEKREPSREDNKKAKKKDKLDDTFVDKDKQEVSINVFVGMVERNGETDPNELVVENIGEDALETERAINDVYEKKYQKMRIEDGLDKK